MESSKGMKYALTAAVTAVLILLGIVAYLLLKLAHGEFSCEFHGTFNETVIAVPQSAVNDNLDGDAEGQETAPLVKHHKKAAPPSTPTSGIPLDSPPIPQVVTPAK